jgi:hypothetical protein
MVFRSYHDQNILWNNVNKAVFKKYRTNGRLCNV